MIRIGFFLGGWGVHYTKSITGTPKIVQVISTVSMIRNPKNSTGNLYPRNPQNSIGKY